jgi:hypothetical protein
LKEGAFSGVCGERVRDRWRSDRIGLGLQTIASNEASLAGGSRGLEDGRGDTDEPKNVGESSDEGSRTARTAGGSILDDLRFRYSPEVSKS